MKGSMFNEICRCGGYSRKGLLNTHSLLNCHEDIHTSKGNGHLDWTCALETGRM